MNVIEVCIFTAVLIRISTASDIFYVLPNDSHNISCHPHQCETFSQYLLDNNGTLPVTSNVEYHLLPGEHCLNATNSVVFTNFQNFSLVGKFNEQVKLLPVILIGTNFKISDSYNITIANVVFKKIMLFHTYHHGDLWLTECISCTIENVTLIGYGLLGGNLIGRSYLNNIIINLIKLSNRDNECYAQQGITLYYSYYSVEDRLLKVAHNHKSVMIVKKISVHNYSNICYTNRRIINIDIQQNQTEDHIKIEIRDSHFNHIAQPIIVIKDDSRATMCELWIVNCIFESNIIIQESSIISAEVPSFNASLRFYKCKFHNNVLLAMGGHIISVFLEFGINVMPVHRRKDIITACTIIMLYKCDFITNHGYRFFFVRNMDTSHYCKPGILFIGPLYIENNAVSAIEMMHIFRMVIHIEGPVRISSNVVQDNDMILFKSCYVFTNGPIMISHNTAINYNKNIMFLNLCNAVFKGPITISENYLIKSTMLFEKSDIIFDKEIIFVSNRCNSVITIKSEYKEYPFIKIMQHANVIFFDNKYSNDLLTLESDDDSNYPYPFCLFQYISTVSNTSTITPAEYSVIFTENFLLDHYYNVILNFTECTLLFKRFTSHCKWLPTSVFFGQNPGLINQQIIQINHKKVHHHTLICLRKLELYYNCTTDILGPVYPGQILQVDMFAPCSEDNAVIFAETHNTLLPTTACKIAHQTELLNIINNYSGIFNYTIVSSNTDMCELFLTVSPYLHYAYEVFYVKLLPCPVGFILQNGICDCDPFLPPDIDTCYIEQSVIRRPASMWITAHVQSNDTKYLTGNCPMDYCLPYSSNILLTSPDTQCQFNRTDILCSQCQHPLSMVFGSSRCMECTNVHILISILIILAGAVLVIMIYILNLTVTNGTINGIILYANIISINDSVFLVNDNVYKPLGVFISFTNLDLGIETCFYNGMDSYAKMWLQLFFPSYLIIIAISIIITSRYSHTILRLTYTRSLPVLATLFLLSYNGVLRVVLSVLFSYSTITHLPSGHQQIVWSIDASVILFGVKFTILFIICLVLSLLLLTLNFILLFTRHLSRFKLINRFKPLLDAFQGSYKDKYYYWVGVQIVFRCLFYALYAFQLYLRLIFAVIILILFICYFGYIQPYKNKVINSQELLLLANLTILYAVSYQNSNVFFIIANVMISLAFIQFSTIVLYHFLIYTCPCNVVISTVTLKEKLINLRKSKNHHHDISLLNIPECTYNYSEYQDGLVSDDFK